MCSYGSLTTSSYTDRTNKEKFSFDFNRPAHACPLWDSQNLTTTYPLWLDSKNTLPNLTSTIASIWLSDRPRMDLSPHVSSTLSLWRTSPLICCSPGCFNFCHVHSYGWNIALSVNLTFMASFTVRQSLVVNPTKQESHRAQLQWYFLESVS